MPRLGSFEGFSGKSWLLWDPTAEYELYTTDSPLARKFAGGTACINVTSFASFGGITRI